MTKYLSHPLVAVLAFMFFWMLLPGPVLVVATIIEAIKYILGIN